MLTVIHLFKKYLFVTTDVQQKTSLLNTLVCCKILTLVWPVCWIKLLVLAVIWICWGCDSLTIAWSPFLHAVLFYKTKPTTSFLFHFAMFRLGSRRVVEHVAEPSQTKPKCDQLVFLLGRHDVSQMLCRLSSNMTYYTTLEKTSNYQTPH